jgi:signal transduction histidine kinase/CheY-like chemotaxis protein
MSILRKLPLTLKMVSLTIVVGTFVWYVSDYFEVKTAKKIFYHHLNQMLNQQSQEERLQFDRYLQSYLQVVKLTVLQKNYIDYLDGQNWFKNESNKVAIHSERPPFFLSKSILRNLAAPRFAMLLDNRGHVREVYKSPAEILPRQFYEPSHLLIEKSRGQNFIMMVDRLPYLITSQSVSGPDDAQVTLSLISPIDEEMLVATQKDFPNRLVGLVHGENDVILASSNNKLVSPGSRLSDLQDDYLINSQEFHDYGGSEISIKFMSFVSTRSIDDLVLAFVAKERQQHAVAALIFIVSFMLIMFWITRRVRLLTQKVESFSQEVLGSHGDLITQGDKLNILEDRFEKFTEEVIDSQKAIQQEAAEGAIRQLELERKERHLSLLESVTDAMGVGVIINEGGEARPANTLMINFEKMFGDLSVFDVDSGTCEDKSILDNSGEEHFFQITGHEITFDMKAILVSEITERVHAVQEKEKLQGELLQAQRMESIGRLAGGVAHDFNNLLTAINGYAQLLNIKLKPDDPLRDYVNSICLSGQKAADLTKQLLAFGRKQIINPETLNLNIILDNLFKMLSRLIGEDVEIVIRKADDLWNLLIDKTQIEQIIINLAINARDAMPDGGKLIMETENIIMDAAYANAHPGVKPGDYVRLSVSDNGHGIAEKDLDHIFEPFFTTKDVGKGTGLGLATVYGIIKQNNGSIYVYSEPEKGTTFKIFLPKTDQELTVAEAKPEFDKLPRGSETIMLVEDEPNVRNMIVEVLSGLGYTLIEAEDGKEAIELFEKYHGKIHLLLTDVIMPKISGSELAQKITGKYPDVKVLYMSGYTEDAIIQHGVLKEGVKFLQKPVSSHTLAIAVRSLLDGAPPSHQ